MDVGSLLADLDASPTQHHLVALWRRRLLDAGYAERFGSSRGFVARGGALIAWTGMGRMADDGVRIVGAHSDSPGLVLKPRPDQRAFGASQLGLEVYGSPLLNSWLDRDLRVAGRVVFDDGSSETFDSGQPVARISQLAIHLDRDVNDRGLVLDRQRHLVATWFTGEPAPAFEPWLASLVGSRPVAAWEARLVDHQGASLIGADRSLLASGRLDNQVSCWAALRALEAAERPSIVAVFDHEEVGSGSPTGAAGPLLQLVLEACGESIGLGRADLASVFARSHCVSADNAHAVHPAHPERHDPEHAPVINGGVAVKVNANLRYATDAESLLPFLRACDSAGASHQWFSSRNTQPCGSTIGPIASTRLGIATVDVGVPQWSMHSAREVCGAGDAASLARILRAYLAR
ncbi:MAG: M18 family aminopeptidase [Actinobacteria bacterium]|nr:M18 family aminopeptidase [Actinomycetota bacterium]